MKIAFDLDNTLIRNVYNFPIEQPKKRLFSKLFRFEELREGTTELFRFCQQQNWETWIYTTSFRSPLYIRRIFWLYNIQLDGVINQKTHNKRVKINSSKYPPTFDLDVIIDDSEGVKIESERYHFQAIQIKPENINWTEEIKIGLLKLQSTKLFSK